MGKVFSERMGFVPPRALQINALDLEARTVLWNLVYRVLFEQYIDSNLDAISPTIAKHILRLWTGSLKRLLHELPTYIRTTHNEFFAQFTQLKWYGVLDFIENCARLEPHFASLLNSVLESENIAYRLVGNEIVPLTNATEIAEVEEARRRTATTTLAGARAHIDSALEKLGQKPTPDVRNAIKEAISAVEMVARQIAGEGNALGPALKKIDVGMNPALKQGLEKLYGWTNGDDGIRHAMMGEVNLGVEDARFMVVTCSAFVNYLIVKADRAGLSL